MGRLHVLFAGGLALMGSTVTSGQMADATAPPVRVEHLRTFGGGPLPGHLRFPSGITVDEDGFLIVADTGYGRIQLFDRDGALVRVWGSYGVRPGQFRMPGAVAIDADGLVYVADTGNHRIQVLTRTGTFVRMWGGEGSGPGQFQRPRGLAVSRDGQVFVADTFNYRVQVFNRDGQFLRMWGEKGNGPGQFMHPKFPGGNGDGPWGVAIDDASRRVYVTDPWNFRVQVFTEDGVFLREFGDLKTPNGSFNTPGAIAAIRTCGKLNTPAGIAVGPSGDVFLVTGGFMSSPGSYTVQVFSPDGTCLRRWGADGDGPGQFETPVGVAVDARGDVFVTDEQNRVQRFRSDGRFVSQWGAIGKGRLRQPSQLATDADGRVYVTEPTNRRIQQFTSGGEFLDMWSPRKDVVYSWRLERPREIAPGTDGRVYVGQWEDRVLVLSSIGLTLDVWERDEKGRRRFESLRSIAADRDGQVYVLHSRTVTALTPGGQQLWRAKLPRGAYFAISLDVHGQLNVGEVVDDGKWIRIRVLSRTGKTLGSWKAATPGANPKMAFDRAGRLLVSDWRACTIRIFANTGKPIGQWGGCGHSDGRFEDISSIAVNAEGNVYVADYALNRVQVFRLTDSR